MCFYQQTTSISKCLQKQGESPALDPGAIVERRQACVTQFMFPCPLHHPPLGTKGLQCLVLPIGLFFVVVGFFVSFPPCPMCPAQSTSNRDENRQREAVVKWRKEKGEKRWQP